MKSVESQQVSWWSVREFAQPRLDKVDAWPLLGSPAWCALDDRDPAKWAAVLDAAQHWALRLETLQEARCEAAKDIAGAADWRAVASQSHSRAVFYAEKPYLKRVAG